MVTCLVYAGKVNPNGADVPDSAATDGPFFEV